MRETQIRFFLCVLAVAFPRWLCAQALPGLVITNNQFTYAAADGQVTGIIRMPAGNGPFPAVLISHGKGGTASGFSLQHANILVDWGFACIGPSYTHEGSSVNPPENEGYCPENSRRARRALEILASAPSVDLSRVALFGHSMGAFLSGGLAGEIPAQIKAVCLSAGGTAGLTDVGLASPALQEVQGITAPVLMFHGTADTTVLPSQSLNLQNLLNTGGTPNKRLLYQGIGHDIISPPVKRTDIHAIARAWFTQHGVLAFPGNTAPGIQLTPAVTIANGMPSAPIAITLGDAQTAAVSLTMQAFTTDDTRLPNSSITLGGSGANRTITFTPPAAQTGPVEVVLIVSDGQLSTAAYLDVTLENPSLPAVNHRPECSWIADQRTTPGVAVTGIAFTIGDYETATNSLTVTAASSNPTLLPLSNITLGGSGASRTVSLAPVAGQSGIATITLTIDDGTKTFATAFTLTVAATVPGNTPPTVQAVPGGILPSGTPHGSLPLIIRDTEQAESSLTVSASSSNTTLVPVSNIILGGQSYGRTVQAIPVSGLTGRAVVTLTVSDGGLTSSTAFVIDVIGNDTPPAIVGLPPLYQGVAPFTVQDGETDEAALRITATSSNPSLLPPANIQLGGTGAARTISLTPLSGQTGAATVTLRISDGVFVRSASILCVVTDIQGAAAQFSRPRGIYVLDSGNVPSYTTSFGSTIALRDANIRALPFVDGFTLRVAWSDIESGATPGQYDFFIIRNLLEKLPAGQKLSLIIVPTEPAYIAAIPGVQTWSDAGTLRATPWDPTLRERRRAMLHAMGNLTTGGVALRDDPRLDLLDPYLAGGFTGIRDPNSTPLRDLPGYSRAKLLEAVRDELRSLQSEFPGKFVQIGFWPITDGENAAYSGLSAAEWIRQELLSEFNGTTRPRVGFFMENLAAKRSGLDSETSSSTPVTSFANALHASRDATWNGFQMLGSWVRPFNDGHVTNNLYGAPGNAMEHAFSTYRAEYHEVYVADVDHAAYHPALQGWHDFFASKATTHGDSDEDGDGLPYAWENQFHLPPALANDANDDSDHDGLPLLLEYALNANPSANSSHLVPNITRFENVTDGLTYLNYHYTRRTDAPHLTYRVQVATGLGNWQSGPAFTQEISAIPREDGVSERVTVRISTPMSERDQVFVRLAATHP